MKLEIPLIAAMLAVTTAHAQTPAALMYDAKTGPIAFGASDLKTALTANGHTLTVLPPGDPAQAKQSVRIIFTTRDAKLPGQPATKGMLREGYAIQRVTTGTEDPTLDDLEEERETRLGETSLKGVEHHAQG
jgi:hypothetical protein